MKLKTVIFFAFLLFLVSCYDPCPIEDIGCKYNGAVVFAKHDFRQIDYTVHYTIKYNGDLIHVNAAQIYWYLEVGDTLKDCK